MKRTKILSVLLVVGLSIFMFSGCGGSSDESASSSSSSSSSTESEATVYTQDFKLVNDTGVDFAAVYVSPTGQENWGEDIMDEVLPTGSYADVTFDTDVDEQYWDIMVEDSEGTQVYWTEIDLFSVSEVDLQIDADGNPVATFN